MERPCLAEVCSKICGMNVKCQKDLYGCCPNHNVSECALITKMQGIGRLLRASYVPVKVFTGTFTMTTALLVARSVWLYRKNRRRPRVNTCSPEQMCWMKAPKR
jgi:hypothetical protein